MNTIFLNIWFVNQMGKKATNMLGIVLGVMGDKIIKDSGMCPKSFILKWWAMGDSNARPLAPEANALSS